MAVKTPDNTISIFSLLETLKRRKLFVIIPTILVGAGFFLYAWFQPNRYRAQTLLAAEHLTPPGYLKEVAPQPLNIQEHLWTVREVLFAPPVLEAAARVLPQYQQADVLPAEAVEMVKKGISIKVESEHTFTIAYDGDEPRQVADVANALARMFVDRASAKSDARVEDAKTIIQQQLDALKARLEEQDRQVRQYKQNAAHELPEHVDANIRVVDELQSQQLAVASKIADDEARRISIEKEMRELEAQGALDQPVFSEKTPNEARLDELRIRREELRTRYTSKHPEILKIESEIRELEASLKDAPGKLRMEANPVYLRYVQLKSELEGVEQRIRSYAREQKSIMDQINAYRRRIESAPQHERALDAMTREMLVGESQLHALLDKQLDASISEGLGKSKSGVAFAVVEPASVPSHPFSPRRERIILMGICAGFGLGLILAFFMEQSDTTFGNIDDFQTFTNMPLIGVIPTVSGQDEVRGKNALVALTAPDSVPAEQYRILGMKIHQLCLQEQTRVLMVTSAAGGEGKSMTAINLSLVLTAMAGGPVLLVDADMRRPRLHEYFGIEVERDRGFYNLILKPDDDIHKYLVRFEHLSVIPGSAPNSNPVGPLASPRVRTLFDRFRTEFGLIVVDAPPTLPIADSHILSGLCDKVLFVVRARRTPRELFQHAVESFDAGNLIGAVLNDVEHQRRSYGYAYEYYRENYLIRK